MQLDQGVFEKCDDVNILANLIKVWLRDMPIHVLDGIEQKVIIECDSVSILSFWFLFRLVLLWEWRTGGAQRRDHWHAR